MIHVGFRTIDMIHTARLGLYKQNAMHAMKHTCMISEMKHGINHIVKNVSFVLCLKHVGIPLPDNSGDYLLLDGTCNHHILEEQSSTVIVKMADCQSKCQQYEECVGFSISFLGCYLHNNSCSDDGMRDNGLYGGWYYHTGMGMFCPTFKYSPLLIPLLNTV